MKKSVRIVAAVAALVFVLCFAACGKKEVPTAKDYDVDEIALSIRDNVPFEDPYISLVGARDFALTTYRIDGALVADEGDHKASAIYVSGAYPEMIVAIKAVDEASAGQVMDAVKALIKTYIENYTTYTPDQVAKLESAVTEIRGQYVFAVVSNDNAAAATYLKGLLEK